MAGVTVNHHLTFQVADRDCSDCDPYVALWRAVLARAMDDATAQVWGRHLTRNHINEAVAYLTDGNSDFLAVCEAAEIPADRALTAFRKMFRVKKYEVNNGPVFAGLAGDCSPAAREP